MRAMCECDTIGLWHQLFNQILRTLCKSQGGGLGLETVSRRTNVSSPSRLEKNCQRLGLVSAIYISCPRPIFGQIVQATVRSVNGL